MARFVAIVFASLVILCSFEPHARASDAEGRVSFTHDLSRTLLGNGGGFIAVGEDLGWQGIVLAPPGTSLAPITEAYSGVPGELSQVLANNVVFDRPLTVVDGFPIFSPVPLASVWNSILEETRPADPLPRDRLLTWATMKWLFSPIIKSGKVTGYTREPSRYMKKYREFEEAYSMLQRGRDSGLWKLDARLRHYSTYEEATAAIMREWYKSGFKAEVDAATWSFQTATGGDKWKRWASANEQFKEHMLPVSVYTKRPETYLLPPPASWSNVSSWIRAVSRTTDGAVEYRLQLARIKVARPWFDIDALISRELTFPNPTVSASVSDGTVPSAQALPKGRMAAFVDELIIARDVKLMKGEPDNNHPLSKFAYPDGINIVGYVVKVLPKIPSEPNRSGDVSNGK